MTASATDPMTKNTRREGLDGRGIDERFAAALTRQGTVSSGK